jgi:hypothetical protein
MTWELYKLARSCQRSWQGVVMTGEPTAGPANGELGDVKMMETANSQQ